VIEHDNNHDDDSALPEIVMYLASIAIVVALLGITITEAVRTWV